MSRSSARSAAHTSTSSATNAVSPARREAFAILLEIDRGNGHSDELLRGSRVSALSPQDRNLATALVMGTLRWQIRLDALIRPLLARPNTRLDAEIRVALRMGAFQLFFLDRVPAHAAIGESVELAKAAGHRFAAGMVNAVLRKLASIPKPSPDLPPDLTAGELSEASGHPRWIVERWASFYGLETARAICAHGQREPELSVRLDRPELEVELSELGIRLEPGTLLTAARRVLAGDVGATAAFRVGRVRIQDQGSQLVAELAACALDEPRRILDCCAAPGGKTLILAERNPQAQVTAIEMNPARFQALQQRFSGLEDAGLRERIGLLQADAAQLQATSGYDLALADVPCSGTGTLSRNPEIRHRLEPEELARQATVQRAILHGVLRACGQSAKARVVYSTCSLEQEENREVIAQVLAETPGWRQASLAGLIGKLLGAGRLTAPGAGSLLAALAEDGSLTLLPGKLGSGVETDGFFIAMLEKRGS